MDQAALAQVNIARMRAPLSPAMAGFVAKLDEINALADRTWRAVAAREPVGREHRFGSQKLRKRSHGLGHTLSASRETIGYEDQHSISPLR